MPSRRNPRYGHRWRKLKATVRAEETVCWRCRQPIDYSLPYPHPYSFTVGHIQDLVLGGDPYARDNVHAEHFFCNVRRSRGVTASARRAKATRIKNSQQW